MTADQERDQFDGVVRLDPPIVVSASAGGKSHHVTIQGMPAIVTLPTKGPRDLRPPAEDGPLEIPRFPPPPLAKPITHGARINLQNAFGVPRGALVATAIRIRWRDPAERRRVEEDDFFSDGLPEQIGPWLALVRDWLSAWTGAPRQPSQREGTPRIRYAVPAVYGGAIGGGGRMDVVVRYRVAYAREVRAAFIAASEGVGVPAARQLLQEAEVSHYRDQQRQAIVAACSAAEVALNQEAARLLIKAGYSDAETDRILRRTSGIMELYRIAATRRGRLPVSFSQVADQLADPRNSAVHAGRDPDEETGHRALATARALLDVSPLPTPTSFIRRRR